MKKIILFVVLMAAGCVTDSKDDAKPVVDVDLTKGFALSAQDLHGQIYLWNYQPPYIHYQHTFMTYYSGPSSATMVGDCVKVTWDLGKDSLCQIEKITPDSVSAIWHGVKLRGIYAK